MATQVAPMIKDAEFGRSTEVADVSWITPIAVADWPTRKYGAGLSSRKD